MGFIANGRLTDLGAILLTVAVTFFIVKAVIAKAYRQEPARLHLPLSWSDALTRWHNAQKG